MLNGMTNIVATSKTGDLYRNIDSIESKCAQLISQIDDHLCVSDSRSLITRNDTGNESVKDADTIFLCCHQTTVDYSAARKTTPTNLDVQTLPKLHIAKELCDKMTKINQPLPEDLLSSLLKPTLPPTKCAKIEPPLKPVLKKQVAFNFNIQNGDVLGLRNGGNVASFECSHYSPTYWQNQHKCLADTKDSHAAPTELVIDSRPHVHNGERPTANSTAVDNIRAFLFGSSRKDGKLPKATKNTTIVSVKTKRDLRKKKLKRWPEKLKMDEEAVRGKSRRKVLFKMNKPVAEDIIMKNGQIRNNREAEANSLNVPNVVEKLLDNKELVQNRNKEYYKDEKMIEDSSQNNKAGKRSSQQSSDEITERKLASQLLRDSMKFCLKNQSVKEKKITFSLP